MNTHLRRNRAIILFAGTILSIVLGVSLRSTPVGHAIIEQLAAQTAPVVAPSPSPSPMGHDAASGLLNVPPNTAPEVSPAPPASESFPAPPVSVAVPSGQPELPRIPQTMVNVGVGQGSTGLIHGGDPVCAGSCTVVWIACFQGGFTGSTVELCGTENTDLGLTFTWSDGHVGSTNTVTYSAIGTFYMSVSVTEAYQGHTYFAGSGNRVPVIVEASAPVITPAVPSPTATPASPPSPAPAPVPTAESTPPIA